MQTLPSRRSVNDAQLNLLPTGVETSAEWGTNGIDVAAISIPAREFTGDFYFVYRSADAVWLALGDVAGKGLNAALLMAMLQEEVDRRLTSCAASACDPAQTIRRLHEFLLPLHEGNRFVSLVIARIHQNGTVRIANAGHPPPLIARAGGSIDEIGSTGPVAGLLENAQWRSVERELAAGETLLLYTDGAIEANEFGVAGVSASLRAASSAKTSREIAAAVSASIHQHGGVDDDLTLLVAHR